jgi:hypothetical protein
MAIYKNTPPIVTNGLVMHLDAGSRQSYVSGSTTWRDLSGQGNTATLKVFGTPSTSASFSTDNQGSIVFIQSGSYADCGNILNYTTSDFSFSYWVKISNFNTNSVGQGPIIFYKGGYQSNGYYNQIYGDGSIYLHTNQAGANQVTGTTAPEIIGNWSNIAFTRSSSSVRVYVNGVDKTTSAGSHINPASSSNVFTINVYAVASANIFGNIQLSNFMNYNRALSAQEVAQNYNALKSRFGLT